MKIEIEITQEQAERLAKGESVEIRTVVNKQIEKWQPKGGDWYVDSLGEIEESFSDYKSRGFGSERETEEEAEYARDQMRIRNRLLAYVAEFDKDWKADWNNIKQTKYYVYFNHTRKKYDYYYNDSYAVIGTVYMSEQCANKLCEKLNSSEVEL